MRVLLIEDEAKVAALVKRGLTAETYAVDVAEDGREGLAMAEAHPYDLILIDLMLPTLPGIEVLQRIRRNNEFVPIMILTARDRVEDKVKLFDTGADDYLTKPFAFAELRVRVQALLRRGPVNRASTLRSGELELDRLTHMVKVCGEPIELTAKEYALLEYVMQNPNRVLSRSMIIEHVWNQTFDGVTNIVDVHVQHLRSKIEERTTHQYIRTVRGSGYMLRPKVG